MGFKTIGKREISVLEPCECCPAASFLPAPRSTRAQTKSRKPAKLPAVPPKFPAKPLPSPSNAVSGNYGVINLDDLKKEIEKNCACKICVLKTYEKIHTDFITYANEKQKENIQ